MFVLRKVLVKNVANLGWVHFWSFKSYLLIKMTILSVTLSQFLNFALQQVDMVSCSLSQCCVSYALAYTSKVDKILGQPYGSTLRELCQDIFNLQVIFPILSLLNLIYLVILIIPSWRQQTTKAYPLRKIFNSWVRFLWSKS